MSCKLKNLKDYGFNTERKVYIIAEIGINHNGDMVIAKGLIDSASRAGADAVKFQTYITEKRAVKGSSIFEILKKCQLPFTAFKEIKDYAEQRGLTFFSTPFDEDSVECLESLGCQLYKIASFDVVNHKLLSRIAELKKTVIMSVGMANLKEIEEAYSILRSKTEKIALLHCISAYPCREKDANLAAIYTLKEKFDCVVGQSDHTSDIAVSLYAIAAGAQIIEKHYKIDDDMDCVDAPVSITEEQMKELVSESRRLERIFGEGDVGLTEAQRDCEIYRRYSRNE